MKTTEILCGHCGIRFAKQTKEYKRSKKLGRKHYCSRQCSGKASNTHLRKYNNPVPTNKGDKYTIVRKHLSRTKKRNVECDLTLDDLLDVWISQKGKCVYSGIELKEASYSASNNPIYTMSLDRINSSLSYTKNNVQFISIAMNHMKNSMTHEQTLELIKIIRSSAGPL